MWSSVYATQAAAALVVSEVFALRLPVLCVRRVLVCSSCCARRVTVSGQRAYRGYYGAYCTVQRCPLCVYTVCDMPARARPGAGPGRRGSRVRDVCHVTRACVCVCGVCGTWHCALTYLWHLALISVQCVLCVHTVTESERVHTLFRERVVSRSQTKAHNRSRGATCITINCKIKFSKTKQARVTLAFCT